MGLGFRVEGLGFRGLWVGGSGLSVKNLGFIGFFNLPILFILIRVLLRGLSASTGLQDEGLLASISIAFLGFMISILKSPQHKTGTTMQTAGPIALNPKTLHPAILSRILRPFVGPTSFIFRLRTHGSPILTLNKPSEEHIKTTMTLHSLQIPENS